MLIDKENTLQPFTVEEIITTNNANFTGGAIQTKNRYVTAMQVIKPRNLNKVISKCVEEASIAGEEFLYSWKQGVSSAELK